MNEVLIAYASSHGQTEKIAHFLKSRFEEVGNFCEVYNLNETEPDLNRYDVVVFGGPVYAGKFPKKLLSWAKRNRGRLSTLRTGFFTVSMNAADQRDHARNEDSRLIREFIMETRFQPTFTTCFAGAIKYLEYNWFIRLVMKHISRKAGGPTDTSKNYEFTDWNKVERFATLLTQREPDKRYSRELAEERVRAAILSESP